MAALAAMQSAQSARRTAVLEGEAPRWARRSVASSWSHRRASHSAREGRPSRDEDVPEKTLGNLGNCSDGEQEGEK